MARSMRLKTKMEGLGFVLETDFKSLFWRIFHQNIVGLALTDRQGKILVSNQSFAVNVLQASAYTNLSAFVASLPATGSNASEAVTITSPALPETVKLNCIDLQKDPGAATYLWVANINIAPKANEQVLVLKNLYQSFIDTTFQMVFRTSQTGWLRYANKMFIESFGFESFQKAKETSISALFERIEDYQLMMDRILAGKRIVHEIFYFRTISGKRLVGLVNCQFYKEADELMLNWTVLDISQPVEFEGSLNVTNETLENGGENMDKVLYSTFYDLRSPITSIMGLADLMRMETKDQLLTGYIEKIETSAFKLDKIIRDLTGFSKTYRQQTKCKKVDPEKLVWNRVSRYSQDENFKGIHFEVSTNQDFPFYTDQDRFEIILDNIIRNAVHFYDRNKIRSFVRVNIKTGAEEILVEVIDNGIGIDKAHQVQIFNMFYKVSNQSRGAGLGLYIVKESLEQLKGSVTLESEIGFGTVFRIRIPNSRKPKPIRKKLIVNY